MLCHFATPKIILSKNSEFFYNCSRQSNRIRMPCKRMNFEIALPLNGFFSECETNAVFSIAWIHMDIWCYQNKLTFFEICYSWCQSIVSIIKREKPKIWIPFGLKKIRNFLQSYRKIWILIGVACALWWLWWNGFLANSYLQTDGLKS